MKFFMTIPIALFALSVSADCQYTLESDDLKVAWTAYKTPSKVGVGGQFTELGIDKKKFTASSVAALFKGMDFAISTKSVATKDKQRDKKIHSFFFKDASTIKGEVLEASEGSMTILIEMNGVKKEVPLNASLKGDAYKAEGVIDVMDFSMNENLKAITKACEQLHMGKTWSDVDISLSARIHSNCK